MQQLPYFPEPYPDECYYSILCRYFVRSADISHQKIIEELYGRLQSMMSLTYIARGLEFLHQWIPESSGITRKVIVENHTMYPYMSIFYPDDMIAAMSEYIKTGKSDYLFEYKQIRKSMQIKKDFLCFCPACATEDENLYGESYWHRLHQIQGVIFCPKHGINIENSTIPMARTAFHFHPASSFAVKSEDTKSAYPQVEYKKQYVKLADDIDWLLKNGLTLGGAKAIGEKYKEMYMEKGGITTIHGRVFRDRFAIELRAFYGEEFLNQILSIGGYVKEWDRYAVASGSEHVRPLHQLLIMDFLCGNPKGFRDTKYQNAPYGYPPWPCVNKHCTHFGIDGIDEVELKYDYHYHIGYFRCKYCGMVYRRINPSHSFDEYSKWAKITEYGHLWENKLRDCIIVKKMIQKDIVNEMQLSAGTLRGIAEKLGLDINANAKFVPNKNPGEFYRKEVLLLLEKQPEISSNDVNRLIPRAYAWFHVNDFDWLQNLLTPEKEKTYWKEKDERLLALFQSVYADLQQCGDTRRRVTIGYLCSLARITGSKEQQQIKNQINLLPKLKCFMDSVLETEDMWFTRRVTEIAVRQRKAGCLLKITQIRKEIHVRTSKFNLYRDFILKLLNELNDLTESQICEIIKKT